MDMRGVFLTTVDYFMLGLVYLCKALTYVLPVKALYRLFTAVGTAFFYARPGMRRNLIAKVRDAMPEITDERELERIACGACISMVLPVLEGLLFWRYSDRIMQELVVEGMENFDRADAGGKGVLVFSMHGAATILQCHLIMARLGKPYTVIAWDPENLPVPRYTRKMAQLMAERPPAPPHKVIYSGRGHDAIGPMNELMASGGRLGLVIDVPGGCVVPLFGRPAAIADGIARLACKHGAPIVPISMVPENGTLRRKIKIHEPLHCEPTGDRKRDVAALMEKAAFVGEGIVREAPEFWMCWFGLWRWWERAAELLEKGEEE